MRKTSSFGFIDPITFLEMNTRQRSQRTKRLPQRYLEELDEDEAVMLLCQIHEPNPSENSSSEETEISDDEKHHLENEDAEDHMVDDADEESEEEILENEEEELIWDTQETPIHIPKFNSFSGVTQRFNRDATELDYFFRVFPPWLFSHVSEQTNLYAQQIANATSPDPQWRDTCPLEMQAFFWSDDDNVKHQFQTTSSILELRMERKHSLSSVSQNKV